MCVQCNSKKTNATLTGEHTYRQVCTHVHKKNTHLTYNCMCQHRLTPPAFCHCFDSYKSATRRKAKEGVSHSVCIKRRPKTNVHLLKAAHLCQHAGKPTGMELNTETETTGCKHTHTHNLMLAYHSDCMECTGVCFFKEALCALRNRAHVICQKMLKHGLGYYMCNCCVFECVLYVKERVRKQGLKLC